MARDSQPKWMWFHKEQIIRPMFIYSKHFVFDFHWCMFIDRTFQEINFARVAARSRQNHDDHINYWYVGGSSAHNKYVYHYNQKRVIHQSLFEIDNTIFYKSRVVQTQRIQWSSIQIIMQASNTEYHLLHCSEEYRILMTKCVLCFVQKNVFLLSNRYPAFANLAHTYIYCFH